MGPFFDIYDRACARKGQAALEENLPEPKSLDALRAIPDDRYLSMMATVIFRSGFSWKVVENKWPGFEEAFEGFDPHRVAMYADEELERLVSDKGIIRNGQKIKSVIDNAGFIVGLANEHGSAGSFFASWPADDFTGLWTYLKKNASRLGGNSGPLFLREMGWDTPMMSRDVVRVLIAEGVVDKAPTSQKALAAVQEAFNAWSAESGRPNAQISRIMAQSIE